MMNFTGEGKYEGFLIHPNGDEDRILPKGYIYTLDELYAHLGCDAIEIIYWDDEIMMIADEDGWLKSDATINTKATSLVGRNIAGKIVIIHVSQFD